MALSTYLKEIKQIPLLSQEEEVKIAEKARKGSKKAKQRLIQSNLLFVVQVAKSYQCRGLSLMDIISEGNLGLMRAVESFDPRKGYHFISYAVHWIKQSILKAISERSRLFRLPLNLNNHLAAIEKDIRREGNEGLLYNSFESLSKERQMKKEAMINLFQMTRIPVSLDMPLSNKSMNEKQVKDLIRDRKTPTPEYYVTNQSLEEQIEEAMAELTFEESQVIQWRFGLNGSIPKTLNEIGQIKKLSKERIRQIESKAINKLKEMEKVKRLEVYVA